MKATNLKCGKLNANYIWTLLALAVGSILIATLRGKSNQLRTLASLAPGPKVTPAEFNRRQPGSLPALTRASAADTNCSFAKSRWQLKGGLPPMEVGREFYSGDTSALASVGQCPRDPSALPASPDRSQPGFATSDAA